MLYFQALLAKKQQNNKGKTIKLFLIFKPTLFANFYLETN